MKKLILLALVSIPMLAQETINYSGAAKVIPFPVVNATPGACSPGQVITRIDLDDVYICNHTGAWIGLGTGSGITSFSVASVPSWLTASVATATTTPALTLGVASAQASHKVLGTCGSGTSVSLCSLDASDLPASPSFSTLTVAPHTPASSSEACTQGQITTDASFVYVCTSTNTWKRAALSSF